MRRGIASCYNCGTEDDLMEMWGQRWCAYCAAYAAKDAAGIHDERVWPEDSTPCVFCGDPLYDDEGTRLHMARYHGAEPEFDFRAAPRVAHYRLPRTGRRPMDEHEFKARYPVEADVPEGGLVCAYDADWMERLYAL